MGTRGVPAGRLCGGRHDGAGLPGEPQREITAEEIQGAQAQNAFDLIRALRPHWLEGRGPQTFGSTAGGQVVVYLDGTRMGGVEVLRQVRAVDIQSAQFMGSSEAASRYGLDHSGGAILITTKR